MENRFQGLECRFKVLEERFQRLVDKFDSFKLEINARIDAFEKNTELKISEEININMH